LFCFVFFFFCCCSSWLLLLLLLLLLVVGCWLLVVSIFFFFSFFHIFGFVVLLFLLFFFFKTNHRYLGCAELINGNAVYNLRDPEFRDVMDKIMTAFVKEDGARSWGYDAWIFHWLKREENFGLLQKYLIKNSNKNKNRKIMTRNNRKRKKIPTTKGKK